VSERSNRVKSKGDNKIYYFIIKTFIFESPSIGYFSKKNVAEMKVWRVRG
jgi:hypothetical protein